MKGWLLSLILGLDENLGWKLCSGAKLDLGFLLDRFSFNPKIWCNWHTGFLEAIIRCHDCGGVLGVGLLCEAIMRVRKSKRVLEQQLMTKETARIADLPFGYVDGDTAEGGVSGFAICGDGEADFRQDATVVSFIEKEEVALSRLGGVQQDKGYNGQSVLAKMSVVRTYPLQWKLL